MQCICLLFFILLKFVISWRDVAKNLKTPFDYTYQDDTTGTKWWTKRREKGTPNDYLSILGSQMKISENNGKDMKPKLITLAIFKLAVLKPLFRHYGFWVKKIKIEMSLPWTMQCKIVKKLYEFRSHPITFVVQNTSMHAHTLLKPT